MCVCVCPAAAGPPAPAGLRLRKQSATEHFTKGGTRGFVQRLARLGVAASPGASLRWRGWSWPNAPPLHPLGNASESST